MLQTINNDTRFVHDYLQFRWLAKRGGIPTVRSSFQLQGSTDFGSLNPKSKSKVNISNATYTSTEPNSFKSLNDFPTRFQGVENHLSSRPLGNPTLFQIVLFRFVP